MQSATANPEIATSEPIMNQWFTGAIMTGFATGKEAGRKEVGGIWNWWRSIWAKKG